MLLTEEVEPGLQAKSVNRDRCKLRKPNTANFITAENGAGDLQLE